MYVFIWHDILCQAMYICMHLYGMISCQAMYICMYLYGMVSSVKQETCVVLNCIPTLCQKCKQGHMILDPPLSTITCLSGS